jgi:hypothetical protein
MACSPCLRSGQSAACFAGDASTGSASMILLPHSSVTGAHLATFNFSDGENLCVGVYFLQPAPSPRPRWTAPGATWGESSSRSLILQSCRCPQEWSRPEDASGRAGFHAAPPSAAQHVHAPTSAGIPRLAVSNPLNTPIKAIPFASASAAFCGFE